MTRTKATYAVIFGIASLLGLGSSAEAYQMAFRPAPVSVPTFRPAPTPTFRPAPTFHPAPAYRAPSFHPTFRAGPTVRFTPGTFGTSHHSSNSRISRSTGPRLASRPISHPSTSLGRQHADRISRPPVNVPHPLVIGNNPGLGLHLPPRIPPHRPIPNLPPRLGLPYPYPWTGQPGPSPSAQQVTQPNQPQDGGETVQDNAALAPQDDTAQAQQDDTAQATQDDTAQTAEQPEQAAQDQPAQGAGQYGQGIQAQPKRTARAPRRPAPGRSRTMQRQLRQSAQEAAQATEDETAQTTQDASAQTAEEDSGQSTGDQAQVAGEAFYNEPNQELYMTDE